MVVISDGSLEYVAQVSGEIGSLICLRPLSTSTHNFTYIFHTGGTGSELPTNIGAMVEIQLIFPEKQFLYIDFKNFEWILFEEKNTMIFIDKPLAILKNGRRKKCIQTCLHY